MQYNPNRKYFKNIRPGKGSVSFEKDTKKERANKKSENREANKLLKEYGGKFMILAESKAQGISRPDIKRNDNEYIELKCPTSLTALDSRLKDGIAQMRSEKTGLPRGSLKVLVLNLSKNLYDISETKVKDIIEKRISLTKDVQLDLAIVRAGSRKMEFHL